MEKYVQSESQIDLAEHVAKVFRFSQTKVNKLTPVFHFGDFPFAVSVFCFKQEKGYIADYWISGRRYLDDEPRLVMRVTSAIDEEKEIEAAVSHFWEIQLQEMAFGSAMVGGIAAHQKNNMTKQLRDEMLSFHLLAHDRFAEAMGDRKRSRVEQTARWHNLIRSFDVKQTQKMIAGHQWVADLAEEGMTPEEFEKRDRNRSAAINARLISARKKGLLSPTDVHRDERDTKTQLQKRKRNNENERGN